VKGSQNTWPWKLLLVGILLGVAAGTWGAVAKIDYKWRWYRVPQYFLYLDEDTQKIPFDGTVSTITKSGKSATVTLTSETGEVAEVTVDAEELEGV